MTPTRSRRFGAWPFAVAALVAIAVYVPGLHGSWFFDDYPNIVGNPDVQPASFGLRELADAVLSSPASELKRPLASLSFVANFALGGLDPFGWKLANLAIHLANGGLVYLLALALFQACARRGRPVARPDVTAAVLAVGWLLLPINLTAVLYVVQRMESLANLIVLAGLLGYVRARLRMHDGERGGITRCAVALVLPTMAGLLAKETAILLPLYACVAEAVLFDFRGPGGARDRRVIALFALLLVVPGALSLALLAPWLLRDSTWAARDFTLSTRLLSEARIVVDYIGWTLLPLPRSLTFYHDDFVISRGLFAPWTTALSMIAIVALLAFAWTQRGRRPLVALGIALYFASHLLTGTILPLELVYEHRNYFASMGLLLAVVPWLVTASAPITRAGRVLAGMLLLWWAALTFATAHAWSDPLRLAAELAVRAPDSPRAQFGYGSTLVAHSDYTEASPLLKEGFSVLERAAAMPGSSILPEQTMILTRSLMRAPVESHWWDSLVDKLNARAPRAENIEALAALTRCARDRRCDLPIERMNDAFAAAERHPPHAGKLLVVHGDWAWNVTGDRLLGERLTEEAVRAQPTNADARIALARMNIVLGDRQKAREQADALDRLNTAGRFDPVIADLRRLLGDR